jgi:hypothetical protein
MHIITWLKIKPKFYALVGYKINYVIILNYVHEITGIGATELQCGISTNSLQLKIKTL